MRLSELELMTTGELLRVRPVIREREKIIAALREKAARQEDDFHRKAERTRQAREAARKRVADAAGKYPFHPDWRENRAVFEQTVKEMYAREPKHHH